MAKNIIESELIGLPITGEVGAKFAGGVDFLKELPRITICTEPHQFKRFHLTRAIDLLTAPLNIQIAAQNHRSGDSVLPGRV